MSLILSLLGLGGGGIAAIGAHLLFPNLFSGIWTALGKLPRWLIYGAVGLIALTLAVIWHGHEVKQIKAAAFAAGAAHSDAEWKRSFDKLKIAFDTVLKQSTDRRTKITELERQAHDEAVRHNAILADDLRLRGPGRASAPDCRSHLNPGLSGPAGGSEFTSPAAPPAGPEMPAGDREAIVPWGWLVRTVQEHDDALDENATWRRWYEQQAAETVRLKRELPSPQFGNSPNK